MKRAFLIHGWGGHPDKAWRSWLKSELEKNGFEVVMPEMPDTDNPRLDAWVNRLTEVVGTADETCYFVGHSLATITILRYLETLKDERIGGAVFVAGFSDDLDLKEIKEFFVDPIDWEKAKSHCEKFVAIHSDNDKWVDLKYSDVFKENLGAKIIIKHNMKHFGDEDGIDKIKEALDSVLEMSS